MAMHMMHGGEYSARLTENLQVTPEQRVNFILGALPHIHRDLRHLLVDLLAPAASICPGYATASICDVL
jgi:hypothetical protein